MWFREMSKFLIDNKRSLQVFSDNTGAISLVKSPSAQASQRSKHIDVRYFFSRHFFISHDNIVLTHVPTKQQLADPLTKALGAQVFSASARHPPLSLRGRVKHAVKQPSFLMCFCPLHSS